MRSFIILSALLSSVQGIAQFIDDFSDGDILSAPNWMGNTENFRVETQMLQLNAPEVSGDTYLVTKSMGLDDGIWEFFVRMEFGTSASNFTRVYLMSSQDNLTGSLNGYFILIGETEDEISLFRQDGEDLTVLIDGEDKLIDTNPVNVRVRVTRDDQGNWELLHDISGGTSFTSAGNVTDNTYQFTDYFGIRCTYTSSRHDKFFFDDFVVTGRVIVDTKPPTILAINVINSSKLQVQFSENLDPSSVQLADFHINQGVTILDIHVEMDNILLETSELTNGRTYEIFISEVSDENGNEIESNSFFDFQYLEYGNPEIGDILLTEVLFNPRMNAVDFVELYNASEKFFDLSQFFLARKNNDTLDQVRQIKELEILFAPKRYLALCEDSDILAFEYPDGDYNNFVTIDDLPSYNDDEGTVILLSPDLDTLQLFDYQEDFHFQLLKDVEGISLERIVLSGIENDPNLWRSASSLAGFATPGKENSQTILNLSPSGKMTIEPKVFIPGNTGTGRDFTTINYEFNSSTGKFANVTIYDKNGRLVKQLTNGASLSTSGFLRWDGTTDRGNFAKMGYHVVIFEIYDAAGNTETMKGTVVVGRNF